MRYASVVYRNCWGRSGITAGELKCLRTRRTADHASPVDSVRLFRIRCDFNEARFDHHLLGWFVDLDKEFADILDVAAGLSVKNGVCALIHLGWIFAGELRREQRRSIFGPRIAELVTIALGGLGGPFRTGLDVINIVDLIHEQTLGLDDDRDRLKRSNVFQTHGYRAGYCFAHYHVDLGLPREET